MSAWVLVIYIYAGVFAKGDSVALESVPMVSERACEAAAQKSKALVKDSAKEFRHVCLATGL